MIRAGDELPNPSTVVHYAGWKKMATDDDGVVTGPLYTAFAPRPDEPYLSVTWCEYYVGNRDHQLHCAIEALRNSKLTVAPKGCFCVAGTDRLADEAARYGKSLRAVYHPEDDNHAHAGIYDLVASRGGDLTDEERELLDLLADEAWAEFYTRETADQVPHGGACVKSPDVEWP